MTTEIRIANDQTITALWTGKPGRSSLFHSMAGGNCELLNRMDREQILLALVCSKINPFPISGLTGSREKTLATVDADGIVSKAFGADHAVRSIPLGELRKAMVYECGDSCNGPLDGWMRWIVENQPVAV